MTVGLGYLDSAGYETLRRIRDRQYAVLKYPTVTITADEPVDLGFGEDVPDYRQKIVQLKGKNLFDKDNAKELNAYVYLSTGVLTSVSVPAIVYIPCKPNTTYTVSKSNAGTNNRFCVFETDVEPAVGVTVLSSVGTRSGEDNNTSYTITTSSNAQYLGVFFRVTSTTPSKEDIEATIQIEEGPTATSYESYYNIELCKIGSYQDKIYKGSDGWYLHKEILKYQLTGSETYTTRTNTSTTHGKYRITNAVLASSIASETAISCSHFIANAGANDAAYSENAICGSTTSGYQRMLWFSIANSIVGSLDAFKTWVTNNKPTVYYAIATPTDTEITNETLIAQLDALQNSAFDRWTQIETSVQELSLQPYLTVTQGEITGSGKEVMLEGTTEDLLDFVILGDTVQDGTPTPDSPVPVQTVNGDITFDFSGPSGVKRYTMVGKMTLADQRIIDNCGTNEQVQVSFRESKQL